MSKTLSQEKDKKRKKRKNNENSIRNLFSGMIIWCLDSYTRVERSLCSSDCETCIYIYMENYSLLPSERLCSIFKLIKSLSLDHILQNQPLDFTILSRIQVGDVWGCHISAGKE